MRKKLTKMEEGLCMELAAHYPLPLKDITDAYKRLGSFDDLIATLDMAVDPSTSKASILNLLLKTINKVTRLGEKNGKV